MQSPQKVLRVKVFNINLKQLQFLIDISKVA